MPLGMEVGLAQATSCSMETQFPPEKGAQPRTQSPTQFLAHAYCGQMAAWIKMSHGTQENLGRGDGVLDGVPAPPL